MGSLSGGVRMRINSGLRERGPSRLLAASMGGFILFLCSPAGASPATSPHLTVRAANRIALRAAQPYVNRSGEPQGGPVSVVRTRLTRVNSKLVWLVRLHATLFVFKCNPGTAWQGGTCPETPAEYALVRVADTTGRVLRVEPATP